MDGEKKKEIIIEIEHVRITCRRKNRYAGWCRACETEAEYLTATEAATLLNMHLQAVALNIANGIFHEYLLSDGTLLICLNSLLQGGEPPPQI